MRLNKIIFSCLLSFTYSFSSTLSDDFNTKLNYFGNVTGSTIDNDGYYIKNYHANTVDDEVRISPYSKLGLQITTFNDDYMFIAQAISNTRDNQSETLSAELTWLNIKYNMTDNSTVKIGKMQTALFLNSDSLDINYLHNWAKDKNIVYSLIPLKSYDGIEFSFSYGFDDFTLNTTVIPYGQSKEDIDEFIVNSVFDAKDLKMLIFDISNDTIRFRTSYLESAFSISMEDTGYNTLINTYESLGYDMSRYTFKDKYSKILSLGLEYIYDEYTLSLEYYKSNDTKSLLPKTQAYYMMIARKYKLLTAYVMYSENKNDKNHFTIDGDEAALSSSVELKSLLYTTNSSEKTITIGTKYDLIPGIALKLQLDKIKTYDYGQDMNAYTNRLGYTSKDINTQNESIYQVTVGVSFAF